jgi:hypothetical protein
VVGADDQSAAGDAGSQERGHEAGQTELEPERVAAFENAYARVIREGWRENPRRTGTRQQSKGGNLLRRIDEHRAEVLRFFHDFAVPFTNSEIEATFGRQSCTRRSPVAGARWKAPAPSWPSAATWRPRVPVHRRQMGHQQARRAPPALHHWPLAATCNRAAITPFRMNSYLSSTFAPWMGASAAHGLRARRKGRPCVIDVEPERTQLPHEKRPPAFC